MQNDFPDILAQYPRILTMDPATYPYKLRHNREFIEQMKLFTVRVTELQEKVEELSLQATPFQILQDKIRFEFNPESYGPTIKDKFIGIFNEKVGAGVTGYFWKTEALKSIGIGLDEKDKMLGSMIETKDGSIIFATTSGYPYPDCGRLYKLTPQGTLEKVLRIDGRFMGFAINPNDPEELIFTPLTTEFDAEPPGTDPYYQSLLTLKLSDIDTSKGEPRMPSRDKLRIVKFPGKSYFGREELLVTSMRYLPDGRIMLTRYGSIDYDFERNFDFDKSTGEGGGIWILDTSIPDWIDSESPQVKQYLLPADHIMNFHIPDFVGATSKIPIFPPPRPTSPSDLVGEESKISIFPPPMPTTRINWNESIGLTEDDFKVYLPSIMKGYPPSGYIIWCEKHVGTGGFEEGMNLKIVTLVYDNGRYYLKDDRNQQGRFVGWNPTLSELLKTPNQNWILVIIPYNFENFTEYNLPEALYTIKFQNFN